MTRAIVAIIGLAIVFGLAVYGVSAAVEDAGPEVTITDESWTPDAGNVTTLDHSNLDNTDYANTVTVKDNNGDVVDPNVDYEWFENNGTIKTIAGGALDGENSATITYSYETSTQQQRALSELPGWLFGTMGQVLPFLAIIVLFALLKSG